MTSVLEAAAAAVAASLILALQRIRRGPTPFDRMLAAQIFGSGGVAILALLGFAQNEPALLDAGLVLALLAVVAAVAFVRRTRNGADA